jgi:cell division protein ZapA
VNPEWERPLELNEKRESVRVTIFGEDYPVTAPASAEYINELAGYVDRKMRDVTARTQSKQAARIAVLAALNIAHELFSERRDKESQLTSVEAKAQDLLVWMDQKLAETPEV